MDSNIKKIPSTKTVIIVIQLVLVLLLLLALSKRKANESKYSNEFVDQLISQHEQYIKELKNEHKTLEDSLVKINIENENLKAYYDTVVISSVHNDVANYLNEYIKNK